MRFQIGDLVAFKHKFGSHEQECVGKVVEFTVNSPDPEFVVRALHENALVRKDRHELRRPARRSRLAMA